MEEKKNSSIVVIVILVIMLVLVSGYVVYDKLYITNKNNSEAPVEAKEKITITEQQAKDIYDSIIKTGNGGETVEPFNISYGDYTSPMIRLFSDKKVVVNDFLTYKDKLDVVLDNPLELTDYCEDKGDTQEGVCFTFSIDEVKKKYESIFGDIDSITSSETSAFGKCNVNGKYFECDGYGPEGIGGFEGIILKYNKFDYNSDELHVYSKYVFYKDFDADGIHYYLNISYTNNEPSYSNELKELKGKKESEVFNGKFENSLGTYKFTFKKSSSGKYFIYSVEPVK